jgi:hypothetical protein
MKPRLGDAPRINFALIDGNNFYVFCEWVFVSQGGVRGARVLAEIALRLGME